MTGVAISNRRLIAANRNGVTFKYKDYRVDGRDLAALTHSPTTFVHNLGGGLRCVKCAKVGIHLG
jgi:hypothetical protein